MVRTGTCTLFVQKVLLLVACWKQFDCSSNSLTWSAYTPYATPLLITQFVEKVRIAPFMWPCLANSLRSVRIEPENANRTATRQDPESISHCRYVGQPASDAGVGAARATRRRHSMPPIAAVRLDWTRLSSLMRPAIFAL